MGGREKWGVVGGGDKGPQNWDENLNSQIENPLAKRAEVDCIKPSWSTPFRCCQSNQRKMARSAKPLICAKGMNKEEREVIEEGWGREVC